MRANPGWTAQLSASPPEGAGGGGGGGGAGAAAALLAAFFEVELVERRRGAARSAPTPHACADTPTALLDDLEAAALRLAPVAAVVRLVAIPRHSTLAPWEGKVRSAKLGRVTVHVSV